jgi:hypothetical protein
VLFALDELGASGAMELRAIAGLLYEGSDDLRSAGREAGRRWQAHAPPVPYPYPPAPLPALRPRP